MEILAYSTDATNASDKGKSYCNRAGLMMTCIAIRASGSVYLSTHMTANAKVAIKQMDLTKQSRLDLIVNEIMVMQESRHSNIVNFLDSFLVRGDLWVVMEYMEGGALTDVIENNTMTEHQIATVCLEVS
jgi:protein-serine/threonine kinase